MFNICIFFLNQTLCCFFLFVNLGADLLAHGLVLPLVILVLSGVREFIMLYHEDCILCYTIIHVKVIVCYIMFYYNPSITQRTEDDGALC